MKDLKGSNIDAVYITTPIPSHFSVAQAVFANGIARNIFIEKTLASSYDKAHELCELARDSGGTNMVGYMKRSAVTFGKAKELLDEGILGQLHSFDAYAYSSDFAVANGRSKIPGARGGVIEDLGSHVIDLALWFFGDLEVRTARLRSLTGSDSVDYAQFEVEGPKGLVGQFDVSWCKPEYRMPEFGLVIKGDKGKLTVNDDEVVLDTKLNSEKWYRQDLGDNVDFLLGDPEYCREDKEFVISVLNRRKCEPDFLTAAKVDRIIEQSKRKGEAE